MKKIIGLIIVLLLSYWAVKPLFGPGYFPMHDDTQVARVVEMGRALREGQFPVRWVSELGYGLGYPIFNFYGPFPYYVGGFFYALGFAGLTATKLMMGLGLVAAGVTMYLAVSEIAGISGGILASAFYMYAPYHAVDAYIRGAVGEYYALIFLPLIYWGIWRITRGSGTSGLLLGSVGIAGLIVSHTILGYAGMVFVSIISVILGIWFARRSEWHVVRLLAFLIVLGLGLSAFFWLPAITEMNYTNVASQISKSADFHDHFVCVPELWNSPWGFGGSAKGCLDGFPFKVGKEHLLIALFALFGVIGGFIKSKKGKSLVISGLGVFALSVFFMLPLSQAVWETLPLFAYVQYPWRFLAPAIFAVSLMVSGIVFVIGNQRIRWVAVFTCIAIILFVEAKRFVPQYIYSRPAADFETPEDIRYRVSKISDEYLPAGIVKPAKEEDTLRDIITKSDSFELKLGEQTDTYRKFTFRSGTDNPVTVRVAYFPGWHYMVNENVVVPKIVNGLPVIIATSGFTVVQMQFRDTPVRTMGNVLSISSLGIFIYLYDRKNKKTVS